MEKGAGFKGKQKRREEDMKGERRTRKEIKEGETEVEKGAVFKGKQRRENIRSITIQCETGEAGESSDSQESRQGKAAGSKSHFPQV